MSDERGVTLGRIFAATDTRDTPARLSKGWPHLLGVAFHADGTGVPARLRESRLPYNRESYYLIRKHSFSGRIASNMSNKSKLLRHALAY